MKQPIFAANWKMNHGPTAARAFMQTFLAQYPPHPDRTVIIFPSAIALHEVVEATRDRSDIAVGVQNVHSEDKGAFTGELSVPMARDAGATVVLVGHSERRHVFGEGDDVAALKCAAAMRGGLVPMLCVGETLEQRERDETAAVVVGQLNAGVARLDPARIGEVIVAYEPVWAIGTGRTATPADAGAVHATIRAALRSLIGDAASAVPILYGGSVNPGNVAVLAATEDIDGVLVGGASLDPANWAVIAQA